MEKIYLFISGIVPIFLEVKKGLKKIIMSKKILIYAEGKSDRNFLGWYLNF